MSHTKFFLKASLWAIIPLFISLGMNMTAAQAYWSGEPERLIHFNHPFAFVMGFISFFCLIPIVMLCINLAKYTDNIDSLEKSEQECHDMTREMEKARTNIRNLFLKQKTNKNENS